MLFLQQRLRSRIHVTSLMNQTVNKFSLKYIAWISRPQRLPGRNQTLFRNTSLTIPPLNRSHLAAERASSSFFLAASLTVEAAFLLPVFLFAVYLLLFPLKAIDTERQLENRMDAIARKLTETEYIRYTGEQTLDLSENNRNLISGIAGGVEKGTALALVLADVDPAIMRNVYFDPETAILVSGDDNKDSAMIYMKLNYDLNLPFQTFRLMPVSKSLVVNRRAWVGSDGGRGRSSYANWEEMEDFPEDSDADRKVYIGRNSTRYHEDPHCHYLYNEMETADASQISGMRNAYGEAYHACPSCDPGDSGTVYYFAHGTAYHSSENCKAITAYAQEVNLSEVEYLGPCSYCSHAHTGTS